MSKDIVEFMKGVFSIKGNQVISPSLPNNFSNSQNTNDALKEAFPEGSDELIKMNK